MIAQAFDEDLATAGDLTTNALIPADAATEGSLIARASGRIAGLEIALEAFRTVDREIKAVVRLGDGADPTAGDVLATVTGRTRSLLTAERIALNLLGHLSGIATATWDMVDAVADTGARIADTRKTTPGLRSLEKYAVRVGGGSNHRYGLHDAVMIKDNHLLAVGSITAAVAAVRASVGHTVAIELEIDRLDQLDEALDAGVDIVLLDNMKPSQLSQAVDRVGGRVTTEASGGINLQTVREVAESGVDVISIGWITHSAPRLDVAFDLA